MKVRQLSVFLENKPGQLMAPVQALADAGINLLTLALADTQQFGILRLIVRDVDRAKQVLEQAGSVVQVTDVVAADVPDRPGGLAELLAAIEAERINIEYMYAFNCRRGDKAVLMLRFDDPDAAIRMLAQHGIETIQAEELFDRVGSNVA